jgi:hypothetical protein
MSTTTPNVTYGSVARRLYEARDRAELDRVSHLIQYLKWGWEGEGYRLFVAYGVTRNSGVMMIDCKVDGVVIEPKEGGSCVIRFRVAAHPREDDIGKLVSQIQSETEIELDPPSPEQQADDLIAKTKKAVAEVE